MKISSVGPNFQGKRDNIDAAINVDDGTVRQLAYIKTVSETNYNKKRKIAKGILYTVPIAAGLATAVFTPKKQSKIFSKQVAGLTAKAAEGLKAGAVWLAGLVAIDLMNNRLNALRRTSKTYRDFDNKHQYVSSLATVGAGFGLLKAVDAASGALKDVKAPEFIQKATTKFNRFVMKNETVNNIKNFVNESVAKLPKTAKNAGKFALLWAPETLLISSIMYGLKADRQAHKEFNRNYAELKNGQTNLAQARIRELKVQNDFLMQDEQNREDAALLKNPANGLPQEVLNKIDAIHEEA
mgnify:CR=1 FL=1